MNQGIGIIGGGQLARMMAQPAHSLGFTVTILDPIKDSPAGQVADRQIIGNYTDKQALQELAETSDFITVEVEIADEEVLHRALENFRVLGRAVNPPPVDLAVIQDKLRQKEFLRIHGIPTASFLRVNTKEDIERALSVFGTPVILKARTGGYDGRGNAVIKSERDIEIAVRKLTPRHSGKRGTSASRIDVGSWTSQDDKSLNLYVEQFVPFTKELSVIVARSTTGEIATYPVLETIHRDNICHIVIAPARISQSPGKRASDIGQQVLTNLTGAGVYAVELFLTKDDQVLVNEIAPRVHNSGHLTIEACNTSQFEQHIRAITGMPLGNTNMQVPAAVMINILGEREGEASLKGQEKVAEIPGATLHIYGKLKTRKKRKMGHITVVADTVKEALSKAKKARELISI